MRVIRAVARELLSLFVGDLSHTLAILAWVGVIALLAYTVGPAAWLGPLLFLGLAAILIENVGRARPSAKASAGAPQPGESDRSGS